MFGLPSVKLGRPFGIPLEADASWFLVFFLVAFSLTTSYFPAALPHRGPVLYTVLGVFTALAFFGSLVMHELAHSLVARRGGLKIAKVTLFIFGGISQMTDEPKSPGHELRLALAGPGTSVLIGLLCLGIRAGMIALGWPGEAWVPFEYLGLINLFLAAFNMLPGYPLDGGRVFRAILWGVTKDALKATRWASRTGQAIGMGLIALGAYGVLKGDYNLVWFAVIGWFLSNMSAAAYQQQLTRVMLAGVPLKDIMSSPAVLAPADLSLEEMAHSYFLGGRHSRYPVVEDGHVIGMIDLERTKAVPREQWSNTSVRDVAARDLQDIVAAPTASVESVLSRFEPGQPGAVLVVEDRRLAGIVTAGDIIRLIRGGFRPAS